MKQEIFSKAEVLHHFENIMPKGKRNQAMYVNDPQFISIIRKLNIVEYHYGTGYTFVNSVITSNDVNNIIAEMKMYNQKKNKTVQPTETSNLDEMAKQIAKSGLYRIENGKVYKKTVVWKEL
jgi:hypothetical protein